MGVKDAGSLGPTLSLRFINGAWILVAGWFSISGRLLPRALAYLGVIASIFSLTVALTLFSGAASVICYPISTLQ
jgi:hypothetical protein